MNELLELLVYAVIPPAVVQSHSDVLQQNRALQYLCKAVGIQFEAYSSLGTQHLAKYHRNPVLGHPHVNHIAVQNNCTAAQVRACPLCTLANRCVGT